MSRTRRWVLLGAFLAFGVPAPASANDDGFEVWLNPSVSVSLDGDTAVEIETAQRLRSEADGREDTYYGRLWINQNLNDEVTLSGGVERRFNTPGSDETRILQQLSTAHGIVRARFRLEQRFLDGGRMGLRVRPRLGVALPLAPDGRWALEASAELFLTLRSTSAGGDDGLTGLRTQIAVAHEVSDRLALRLGYLRQQSFDDGLDEVGHAPTLAIDLSF